MNYLLSPSLLSADFTQLGRDIELCAKNGVRYLHVDVMDGVFVPNISIGIPVVRSIRKITPLVLDVHLMITEPERYIEAFSEAGSDIINIHYEACSDCAAALRKIRTLGRRPAVTIKPETDYRSILPLMELADMALVMSVEPGFGGQSFIDSTLRNIEGLAEYRQKSGLEYDIEVDGGIYTDNVRRPLDAGANIIVAGSAVFGSDKPEEAIREFNAVLGEYEKKR